MTKPISRRRFIQLGALTGTAAAVSGCTINLQRTETIEPYVIPPEEALPGESAWHATTCRMCSTGCGVVVRVGNGRARKIEGNPMHPLNAGMTCARGQAGLQFLYNPDRFRNALRNEARGSGGGSVDPFGQRYGLKATAIQWQDALTEVANRIKSAKPGGVAFYSSSINDCLAATVAPFLQALGAPAPVFYDTEHAYAGLGTITRLVGKYFGQPGAAPATPFFNLSTSDVVFSFGGGLLDGGLSAVAYSRSFGEMRGSALGKRGYLVQFEPRMSPMGAVADEWIPILPGTEGLVALAVGRIMIDEKIGNAANSPVAHVFSAGDPVTAASLCGIESENLARLARTFGSYQRPTAIPGASVTGQTNAVEAVTAVLALNALAGHLGEGGSAFTLSAPAVDPLLAHTTVSSYADAQALIDRMQSGAVDVLMVHGNPRYELPLNSNFVEAVSKVPFVVSFSSEADETTILADMILPDHTYLEGWGYQAVTPVTDRGMLTSQQPVVAPLYDTRATTDVILALAQAVGGPAATALPYKNTVEYLQAATTKLARQDALFDTSNGETIWAGFRQYGGWWPATEAPVYPDTAPAFPSGSDRRAGHLRRQPGAIPAAALSLSLSQPGQRPRGSIVLAPGSARPHDHRLVGHLGGGQSGDCDGAGHHD